MLAVNPVDPSQSGRYGLVDSAVPDVGQAACICGMVERSANGLAPTNLAMVGRYVPRDKQDEILIQIVAR